MKCKIKNVIVLCLAIVGLIILSCCVFCENESPYLLPSGLLCITIGNLMNGIFIYKQNNEKG